MDGPQTVRLELPRDVTIRKASLLRAEALLTYRQHGRVVELTVPAVGSYEKLHLKSDDTYCIEILDSKV
jgi:hypothetical protein